MIAIRPRAALAALLLVGTAACARRSPPQRPDVVLVTVDRLRWEEFAPWGGPVQAPTLAAWREESAEFAAVSPAPGGAPAALTVLTGLPPSGHGVRRADDGRIDPAAQALADRLGAAGWATGAFLQTDQVALHAQADRGFGAWDGPVAGFPTAHPGASELRDLEDTVASGLHWLLRAREDAPAFLWIHLAEPAAPELVPPERATRLGAADRVLGAVRDAAAARGRKRGPRPILVICNLSSHGPAPAAAAGEAFLLEEPALRVRILASGPGLPPGAVEGLTGLDEIAPLIERLALGRGNSRLRARAAGRGEPREAVVAETTVPWTCCAAEPHAVVLGASGPARGHDDPAVSAAIASDARWPGGSGGPSAAQALPLFLELDAAWTLHRRGQREEALAAFEAIGAGPAASAPGSRVGLGLALVQAGRPAEALAQFQALREDAAAGTLAWVQARLGVALTARGTGDGARAREALDEILAASPGDVRALTLLAETAEGSGDRAGAVDALGRLLAEDPDNPFALAEMGRLLLLTGRPREAANALSRALARRPTHPGLLLAAAEAMVAAGDWWTANDRINERVMLYGESPETNLLLARSWRDTGRFALVEEYATRYLAARPAEARVRLLLAESHWQQGKQDPGLAEWSRAMESMPGDAASCELLRQWSASVRRDVSAELSSAGCGA